MDLECKPNHNHRAPPPHGSTAARRLLLLSKIPSTPLLLERGRSKPHPRAPWHTFCSSKARDAVEREKNCSCPPLSRLFDPLSPYLQMCIPRSNKEEEGDIDSVQNCQQSFLSFTSCRFIQAGHFLLPSFEWQETGFQERGSRLSLVWFPG